MTNSASRCREVLGRSTGRVFLIALCKIVILLLVFQSPVDVSAKGLAEIEATHLAKDLDTRLASSAARRRSVAMPSGLLPVPADSLRSGVNKAESSATLHSGHTWTNGLLAPLRL